MNPLICLKKATPSFVVLFVLTCFALSPQAQAVLPAPDGGYAGANTAEGANALFSLTTGTGNTAIGFEALLKNTNGSFNTATGDGTLARNTTGSFNTAAGVTALQNNTTGDANTATGDGALFRNTTGQENTATGASALQNNTTGFWNTATGLQALSQNTTGVANTATGLLALNNNIAGDDNTATGVNALSNNTRGNKNTATGEDALQNNIIGNNNTATGLLALNFNNGNNNTATGVKALFNNTTGNNNTADGVRALFSNTTGIRNIALGFNAGSNLTTGSDNIEIGNVGFAGDANIIRIGRQGTQTGTFIAGIRGATVASGIGVIVGSNGQLGTVLSSARFKEQIKPLDDASEAILNLKPVSFHYKEELDPNKIPQFGLIAEEVQKVDPDLVVKDEDGKVMTVRYEAVNAMLLNEFLKEHREVEKQQATIAQMKATMAKQQDAFASKIADQQQRIEALAAGLQKISAAVELNKAEPTQVAGNR